MSFFFTQRTSFPDALVKTASSSPLPLACSAAASAISFSTSPLWDLTLRRKVAAPASTLECSRCMISVRMSASLFIYFYLSSCNKQQARKCRKQVAGRCPSLLTVAAPSCAIPSSNQSCEENRLISTVINRLARCEFERSRKKAEKSCA